MILGLNGIDKQFFLIEHANIRKPKFAIRCS